MSPRSTNYRLPFAAVLFARAVCLALGLCSLACGAYGQEDSDFLDDREPAGAEPFVNRNGLETSPPFPTDFPLGVSDGDQATVCDDVSWRPGLFHRLDMGWRPGTFLGRGDFDWREWVWLPQFGYRDPDDPARHRGWGEPMNGTSWRNRPISVDWVFGGLGTAGVTESVRQTGGTAGGYRLGFDFDHYWGLEWRHLFASANLRSTDGVTYSGTTEPQFYDLSLIWFPWGDARWRPYAGLGLGMANYDFVDTGNVKVDETMLTLPISAGLKYYVEPWVILRADLSETVVFPGSDIDAHVQFMALVGTEFRFGGKRTKYYPWETGWKP